MKILRFALREGADREPQFGILEDDSTIRSIASDPLYAGVHPLEERYRIDEVRLP